MFALNAIKALAIVLVTHSHMRDYYPIREIATGGLLGNTLFFFASGVAITLGLDRRLEPFLGWYARRVRRTYLQMWIVTVLLLLCGIWSIGGWYSLLSLFLVPKHYWFLPAILALYPLCYILIRLNTKLLYACAMAVASALYLIIYLTVVDFARWNAEDHISLKTLFYFIVMVTGIYLAKERLSTQVKRSWLPMMAFATVSFFSYLVFLKLSGDYSLQAGANILALIWTLTVFNALRYAPTEAWLKRWLNRPILFLSRLTLPIYLVQVPLVTETTLHLLPFVLNSILFWAAVLVLAWLLEQLTTRSLDQFRVKRTIPS